MVLSGFKTELALSFLPLKHHTKKILYGYKNLIHLSKILGPVVKDRYDCLLA